MTAITKAWVVIADSAVDADSPVDQALMTGLRDDLVHLREWLGASYFAGAVQDHNHDGVNSALVTGSGESLLKNGGFEDGTTSWTTTAFTGGTVAINTANDLEGTQALGFTSASTANGGGDALSAEVKVAGNAPYRCAALVKASVANVSSKVEVVWYNKALSQISVDTIYTATSTPTTATPVGKIVVSPATARYARVRITGGVPGSGTSAGSIYFDALRLAAAADRGIRPSDTVVAGMEQKVVAPNTVTKTISLWSQHVGRLRVKWTVANPIYGTVTLKKNGTTIGGAASGDDHDCAIGDQFSVDAAGTSASGDLELLTFHLCGDVG